MIRRNFLQLVSVATIGSMVLPSILFGDTKVPYIYNPESSWSNMFNNFCVYLHNNQHKIKFSYSVAYYPGSILFYKHKGHIVTMPILHRTLALRNLPTDTPNNDSAMDLFFDNVIKELEQRYDFDNMMFSFYDLFSYKNPSGGSMIMIRFTRVSKDLNGTNVSFVTPEIKPIMPLKVRSKVSLHNLEVLPNTRFIKTIYDHEVRKLV